MTTGTPPAQSYLSALATEQVDPRTVDLDRLDGESIASLMNRMDAEIASAVAPAVPAIGQALEA
ncbi:MAG: N-acetylmuramic acid 6-phosphate etherase, partial [Clostridia bacterium]|nr:N-acetylmuramic acid 6-phosphate etherase [Clostridia bacterium]